MVKFEFYLSDDDYNRLYAIKDDMGHFDLTGNQFAKKLLSQYLYKLHPSVIFHDEEEEEC